MIYSTKICEIFTTARSHKPLQLLYNPPSEKKLCRLPKLQGQQHYPSYRTTTSNLPSDHVPLPLTHPPTTHTHTNPLTPMIKNHLKHQLAGLKVDSPHLGRSSNLGQRNWRGEKYVYSQDAPHPDSLLLSPFFSSPLAY